VTAVDCEQDKTYTVALGSAPRDLLSWSRALTSARGTALGVINEVRARYPISYGEARAISPRLRRIARRAGPDRQLGTGPRTP